MRTKSLTPVALFSLCTAISKTHIGHFTFYSKTVIRQPENYYIAEDIYCDSYIGGEGTKIYSPRDLLNAVQNEKIGTGDSDLKDMFVVPLNNSEVTNPICITGAFDEEVHGCSETCFNPQDEGEEFLEILKDTLQRATNADEENMFKTDFPRHNTICFRGAYVLPT